MLQNRDYELVIHDTKLENESDLQEEKTKKNKAMLVDYLKDIKKDKTSTYIDKLLFHYLEDEFKGEIKKEVSLD